MLPKLNPTTTCVIADFDGTLIKKVVDGKKVPSLISLLVDEKYLGVVGTAQTKELVAKYMPLELDHSLSADEKSKYMQEWWEASYQIMREQKVSERMIQEICDSRQVQLRDQVPEFVQFLSANTIPLIIYSASGIGYDSIRRVLEKQGSFSDAVQICSNDIVFDSDGFFSHVQQPIIHSANKTGSKLVEAGYLTNPPQKSQCLLIGDSLDDVKMSAGIEFAEVTKVAFADEAVAPKFREFFNVVLPIEGGFREIRELFGT